MSHYQGNRTSFKRNEQYRILNKSQAAKIAIQQASRVFGGNLPKPGPRPTSSLDRRGKTAVQSWRNSARLRRQQPVRDQLLSAELFATMAEAPLGPPGAYTPGGSSSSCGMPNNSHSAWTNEGGHVTEMSAAARLDAMAFYEPIDTGVIVQIRSAYSAIARSLLKKPQFIVLTIDERAQASGLCQA